MKLATFQISRLKFSYCQSVVALNCSMFSRHDVHCLPVMPLINVRRNFLPVNGSPTSLHQSPLNSRTMASPMTRLPEFESTENLVKALFSLGQKKNTGVNLQHLEQLRHLVISLHRDPLLAQDVWTVGLVPKLIEFGKCGDARFERQARMAMSLVGQAPPYAGRGLRILSVDGGGTRFVKLMAIHCYTSNFR